MGGAGALARRARDVVWHEDVLATAAVVVAVVVAMQIASLFAPPYLSPPPAAVLAAIVELLGRDLAHVGITLLRWLAAVAFALLVGSAIGAVMGTLKRVTPYLRAVVVMVTGVPSLSWMLLAVFWFGNPEARIFFIMAMILLPFYAINVYEGIRALPPELVEMAQVFRPTRLQVVRLLVVPHIVPYVLATTKSVVGYAIRMTIFAELIGSAVGIGARMSLAQSNFRLDRVLAWTVVLVVLNLVVQGGVALAEKRLLAWRAEANIR